MQQLGFFVSMAFALIGWQSALAQSAAPPLPPTPEQQALSSKLLEEINIEINLRARVIELQEQIKKLQSESKKPPPPPPPLPPKPNK